MRRIPLTPEQVSEVERIKQKVRDGSIVFATDAQMAAFWEKCGLSSNRQTLPPSFRDGPKGRARNP